LVLAGVLPIVSLSLVAYHVTGESVRDLVVANNRSAARMAAELLSREFENSISLGSASAMIPFMSEAVERHDVDVVRGRLQAAVQAFPRLDRAFVIDTRGMRWADYPTASEPVDLDFSDRDYFRGLSRTWKPYVSEVFQRRAEPRLMVVAVAVPIRGRDQKILGGIVYQHRLEEITRWVQEISVGGNGYVFVLDHHANVAAHPKLDLQVRRYTEYGVLEPVRAALAGEETTVEYHDPLAHQSMMATFMPVRVAGQFWAVVAQQPARAAMAPVRRLGWNLAAATGILAMVALAVVLVLGHIRQQLRKANQELVGEIAERRETEEALQRKQALLNQLLDTYEKHRKIVAYEIHDGIAQPLAGAVMNCEASLRLLQEGDAQSAREGFQKTVEMLRDELGETRRLMRDLRPAILDDFGVIAAIDQMVAGGRAEKGAAIEWSHDVQFGRLAPPLETALFRIIQEGLANALRHSRSDRVRIGLVQRGDKIRLEIADWGVGFDPAKVRRRRFGLTGIRERAGLFGGEAIIDSAPGRGTRITVELPVVQATQGDADADSWP
jgi:signal transduction histidine kinase